jgi:hypothetical protein
MMGWFCQHSRHLSVLPIIFRGMKVNKCSRVLVSSGTMGNHSENRAFQIN